MKTLSIGQVSKQTDVGVETLRYYEREGLIESPPRKTSGYRQYPESVVIRIQFIKNAKNLGFSLKEIQELLSLRGASGCTAGDVKHRAEQKLQDIEQKLEALKKMRKTLKRLIADCAGGKLPLNECPILEALEKEISE